MSQFNMQIDPQWEKKISLLQKRWHIASKAQVLRRAIDLAVEKYSQAQKDRLFWERYRSDCLKVPRREGAKVMSEAKFYKGLDF